jgi:hypothetical protein
MDTTATELAYRGEGELFKKVLGPRWQELHADIRRRFDANPAPGRPLHYLGELSELHCSAFGRVLGWLSMPFAPGALLPYKDRRVPVAIRVYCVDDDPHIFKERTYFLNGRRRVLFTSQMRESPSGEVLEYVGGGLGMKLLLQPRDGDLHFRSDGYFVELWGIRIALPGWLTPGHTALEHCNEGPGHFNIRIEITHPWFGITFRQVGRFREADAGDIDSALRSTAGAA